MTKNRMSKISLVVVFLAGIVSLSGTAKASQIASVSSGDQKGQAVLFPFNGRCLALTANHVVADTVAGSVTLAGVPVQTFRFEKIGSKEDIALLEVNVAGNRSVCDQQFFKSVDVKKLINQDNRSQVRIVDGSAEGRIGGTIVSNDVRYEKLTMRPIDSRDPAIEKGISGGVLTSGVWPIGIVTDVESPGVDPRIIAVSINKIRSMFPDYLPSGRTYGKYDLSWMPSDFRKSIKLMWDYAQDGLDESERAQTEADRANSLTQRSRPVPNKKSEIIHNEIYHFTCGDGKCENIGEIKVLKEEGTKFTYGNHGLGVRRFVAGRNSGKIYEGRFIESDLRLGVIKNGVTPSRPNGKSQVMGSWNDKGKFDVGVWKRDDGRILIGKFDTESKSNWLRWGRVEFSSGSRFEGYFKDGETTGHCVYWNSDGSYNRGGICGNGGKVIKPILQP